jgi:hypothetical protein
MKFGGELYHTHAYRFSASIISNLKNKNVATVRIFDIMCDKLVVPPKKNINTWIIFNIASVIIKSIL